VLSLLCETRQRDSLSRDTGLYPLLCDILSSFDKCLYCGYTQKTVAGKLAFCELDLSRVHKEARNVAATNVKVYSLLGEVDLSRLNKLYS